MKIIRWFVAMLAVGVFIFFNGCSSRKDNKTDEPLKEIEDHVEVIYFHGNMRCLTCRAIEKFAKETVDSLFSDEKKSGKVVFRIISIPDNEAMADSYRTTGSSLFVTSFKNGEEARADMTEFAFRTARKQHQMFQDSLASAVRHSLNNIRP